MICYAVIDTNVLVSALLTGNDDAATVQVINRFITGSIIPVYSPEIINEYAEVLSRKKFNFPKESIDCLLSAIENYGVNSFADGHSFA